MKNLSYVEAVESASHYNRLYQYTTYEALEKIITNNSLRLTRIDLLNDGVENQKIFKLWKNKVYVSCFTHREDESYFFWETYAKRSLEGIRISFETKQLHHLSIHPDETCEKDALVECKRSDCNHIFSSKDDLSSWGVRDYSCVDIAYVPRNLTFDDDDNFQGRIKYTEWDMEAETRLRVAIRPKCLEFYLNDTEFEYYTPENKYIFAKLPKSALKSMTITLSPHASIATKKKLDRLLKDNNLYEDVVILESILTGEV